MCSLSVPEICPCPKLDCPNHGYCDRCTSRHVRLGFLSYCAFHTILPTIRKAIEETPDSETGRKIGALMDAQVHAYERLYDKHDIRHEDRQELLRKVSQHSKH